MNDLEEYRQKMTIIGQAPEDYDSDQIDAYAEGLNDGAIKGFDAAIALDLPVKFHEWVKISVKKGDIKDNNNGSYLMNDHYYISEELYRYWLDNILKLE